MLEIMTLALFKDALGAAAAEPCAFRVGMVSVNNGLVHLRQPRLQ